MEINRDSSTGTSRSRANLINVDDIKFNSEAAVSSDSKGSEFFEKLIGNCNQINVTNITQDDSSYH